MTINFDETTHTYTDIETGKVFISVTQLLQEQQLAPDYSNIPTSVLHKAAEYGTMIHKELEEYIKKSEIGISEELINFIKYVAENGIKPLYSEYLVAFNGVAGTIDFIYLDKDGKLVLVDFKTTSKVYVDTVAWQESVYSYLAKHFANLEIDRIECWHFDKKTHELRVIPLIKINDEEINKLVECHLNGLIYKPQEIINEEKMNEIIESEREIAKLEAELKLAKAKNEKLHLELIEIFKKSNAKKIETDNINITFIDSTDRTSFDSKRFEKEHKDIYDAYTKITTVKPSIKIKLKELKNE